MNQLPKKSLGQHWLADEAVLKSIVKSSCVGPNDTVLEIGPGQGALTKYLLKTASRVIAIELDSGLAKSLSRLEPKGNLKIINQDILKFDLTSLPPGYKIVANIPYYLTGHLVRVISETPNPPLSATLLVQKEVAERITARPDTMSILSVSVQFYFEVQGGMVVPAKAFVPPPKVSSQLVHLTRRPKPLFEIEPRLYMSIVKAGFAGRRKKLRSSLSGGLHISKTDADKLLLAALVDGNLRAQNLSLEDWHRLTIAYAKIWPKTEKSQNAQKTKQKK